MILRILLLYSLVGVCISGPIFPPPELKPPPGFQLNYPGLVPDHLDLYTYTPVGSPPPDFQTCGQIAFAPQLADGSPDPTAPLYYLQINSSCPKPVAAISFNEPDFYDPDIATPIPEPGYGAGVGVALFAAVLFITGTLRKRKRK